MYQALDEWCFNKCGRIVFIFLMLIAVDVARGRIASTHAMRKRRQELARRSNGESWIVKCLDDWI